MSPRVVLAATALLALAGGVFPLSTDSQRAARAASDKVSVSVYYEALCDDSANLFTTQLYPTLQKPGFADALDDLVLVPYGRANHTTLASGAEEITCHHGVKECQGNKVHDCALKYIPGKLDSLKFITCLFEIITEEKKDMTTEFTLGKCADTIPADQKNSIITCATGAEGDSLLAAMGRKTDMLTPKIFFCPTLTYNDIYDQAVEDESRVNFQKVLCEHITSSKPSECSSSAISPALSIGLLLLSAVAMSLL